MPGTLHIFRLDPKHQPYNKLEPQYQANYSTAGNNYAGAFTEAKLKRVLEYALAMSPDETRRILDSLHRTGKATLADVEIPIPETGMLGLEQTPADA